MMKRFALKLGVLFVLISVVMCGNAFATNQWDAGAQVTCDETVTEKDRLDKETIAAIFAGSKAWDEEAQAIYDDTVANGVTASYRSKLDKETIAAIFAGSKAWDEEAQAIYDDTVANGVTASYRSKLDKETIAAIFAGSKAWDEEAQAIYDDTVANGVTVSAGKLHEGNIHRSDPYRETTKTFWYPLIVNSVRVGKIEIYVTGVYSQVDRYAEITDMDVVITDEGGGAAFDAMYKVEKGIGSVAIGYRGRGYGSLTYSISTNGHISEDSWFNEDIIYGT